jgi:murein DD-endopeptidase MepM/ murein hydrolase activator NlpD
MNVSFPTIQSAPVSQVFGNYNPALYGGDRKHKGIDFSVMTGTPVYACMDGDVVYAATVQTGYGRSVRILHPDGAMSIYGHLSKLLVSVGDVVRAGQEIGKSGGDKNDGIDGDGLSTGAHLHWEIRPPGKHVSDQTAVDPMEYCLQYIPAVLQVGETTGGVNVRTLPSAAAGRVGGLFRKEIIYIAEVQNQWGRIHSLRPEWVTMAYVRLTGERVTVNAPAEVQPPAEISEAEKIARLWKAHPELHG